MSKRLASGVIFLLLNTRARAVEQTTTGPSLAAVRWSSARPDSVADPDFVMSATLNFSCFMSKMELSTKRAHASRQHI